jgi:hypothetical protein
VKVFVSHSSRDDDSFGGEMLSAVRTGLAGHQVFVDIDELQPGDEWRAVLYHWLAECQGAVVLLSRNALASPWVRREVNVLLWRRALGYPLFIVPAILDDLSAADLKDAGFEDLVELQVARFRPGEPALDPAELAARVVARFPDAADFPEDKSPMANWITVVAYCLSQVGNRESLVDAARELLVEEAYLDRVRDPQAGCRFLAQQLLAQWHGKNLLLATGKIARFTPPWPMRQLIANVSATWVDSEAARALLDYSVGRPGTVVLNARSQASAMQYVERASCCSPSGFQCETVSAVAGEAFLEEFERDCVKAVAGLLNVKPDSGYTVDEAVPDDSDALFLIIDPRNTPRGLVAEGVRAVHNRFPWLVMVLLTGPDLPTDADLSAWQLTRPRRLEPALGPGVELRALQIIGALEKLRDKMSGYPAQGAA